MSLDNMSHVYSVVVLYSSYQRILVLAVLMPFDLALACLFWLKSAILQAACVFFEDCIVGCYGDVSYPLWKLAKSHNARMSNT